MGFFMGQTKWQLFQSDQRAAIRRETNWTWYCLGKTGWRTHLCLLLPYKCPQKPKLFSDIYLVREWTSHSESITPMIWQKNRAGASKSILTHLWNLLKMFTCALFPACSIRDTKVIGAGGGRGWSSPPPKTNEILGLWNVCQSTLTLHSQAVSKCTYH